MSEDPFDGAREAFAGIRSEIVEHAVKTGFADQTAGVMRDRAAWYMETVTKVAVPYINQAIHAAYQAKMPDDVVKARVQDMMADLSACVQDALRECGMDIQIVALPLGNDYGAD